MKGLIISVGGTPEPVVTALIAHRPDFVIFFSSQQTVESLGVIKHQVAEKGHTYEDYKIICDDVNDLIHCYERALQCTLRLQERNIEPAQVVVDYTGGTKTMTAALTLATVGHGYSFSYIGGKERTKGGQGVVISGTEIVKTAVSPWQLFAVEEKKRIGLFVDSFQYEAAITIMRETLPSLLPQEREIWSGILLTLEGYRAWDNFDHPSAVRQLSAGLKHLERCCPFCQDVYLLEYTNAVRTSFAALEEMSTLTNFFKKSHKVLVRDLVSNAKRRAAQNKYDDAVARLYRALEMVGQIAFEGRTGYSTSKVPHEKLPSSIQQEYAKKYSSDDQQELKLPLFATYRVLAEMDDVAGRHFMEQEEAIRGLLAARNNSILAHGVAPIEKKTYQTMEGFIQELLGIESFIEFPQLNW